MYGESNLAIVFVYPIWWGRPPAMLLGYIDQLFAANFAYRDKKGGVSRGTCKRKVGCLCVYDEGADKIRNLAIWKVQRGDKAKS